VVAGEGGVRVLLDEALLVARLDAHADLARSDLEASHLLAVLIRAEDPEALLVPVVLHQLGLVGGGDVGGTPVEALAEPVRRLLRR
jgi:hypothetical protein